MQAISPALDRVMRAKARRAARRTGTVSLEAFLLVKGTLLLVLEYDWKKFCMLRCVVPRYFCIAVHNGLLYRHLSRRAVWSRPLIDYQVMQYF